MPLTWVDLLKLVGIICSVLVPIVTLAAWLLKRWAKSVKKNADLQIEAAT